MRPGIRVSLLSLLLLTTCAALGVSHWLTSARLRESQARVDAQRREIRELNHKLGLLAEEDLPFVQIRRILTPMNVVAVRSEPYRKRREDWQLHLPSGWKWWIYWADGDIPVSGLPAMAAGSRDVPSSKLMWDLVSVSFVDHGAVGRFAEFNFGGDAGQNWSHFIPSGKDAWLARDAVTNGECAGPWDHHTGECFI